MMVDRILGTSFRRSSALLVFDALAWLFALGLVAALRYDFDLMRVRWGVVAVVGAAAVVLQVALGIAFGVYCRRYLQGSLSEARALLAVVVLTGFVLGVPFEFVGQGLHVSRSLILVSTPGAFLLMGALRYATRQYGERRSKPGDEAQPALLFGAGHLADHLVRRMLTDVASPYVPVGLIDDDPAKRHLRLAGVPVLGNRSDLAAAVARTGARVLVVAVAKADAPLVRDVTDLGERAGLRVLVMPLLDEILEGRSRLGDLRDVAIEDIIGRHPVDTEVESIAGYLTGKRVLVTGAGGSIGSELCAQIARFAPAELTMLDRDETGLQQSQIAISGHGLLDTRDVVLADIRDARALREIFADRRPEVVFHAAALKHLPMLEQYPEEAWKTNVLGTANVLEAARAVGVATLVNVSTDKAANPTSVLGRSKRLAERLTAWAAEQSGERYLSVRFGNVLGSRGSMLPVFTSLIEAGGPVTITHPDVTRFFMTIPEACHLVVQAGGIGAAGEVLVLDMGEPVRILDVAERMIAMSGRDVGIVFTGLRDGEKLHEELLGDGESSDRPVHPKISHTRVPALAPEALDERWVEDAAEPEAVPS